MTACLGSQDAGLYTHQLLQQALQQALHMPAAAAGIFLSCVRLSAGYAFCHR